MEGEEFFMDVFLGIAKKLDTANDKLFVTEEMARFSDAEPRKVRRLRTTAGVVKQVITTDPRTLP